MNIGQNIYEFGLQTFHPLVMLALELIGIFLIYKRKFTELLAFTVVAVIGVGLVFNTAGVKDILLNFFNLIFK